MQLFIELTEFVEELFIGLSEFELIKSVPSTDWDLDACFPIFHGIPPIDTYRMAYYIFLIDTIVYVYNYDNVAIYNTNYNIVNCYLHNIIYIN